MSPLASEWTFRAIDEVGTHTAGVALAPALREGDVVSLSGDLGAGKTVLVKGIARGMGVVGPVTSPTFNILVAHEGVPRLNHFDLYRLERAEQLVDIDFWGVLESGGVSVIEWGDRFPDELPPDHLDVRIRIEPDGTRRFDLRATGPRSRILLSGWRAAMEEA